MLRERELDRLSKKLSKNSKNMLDYKKYLESRMILLNLRPVKAKRRKNEER
jgi:hypothetical protein